MCSRIKQMGQIILLGEAATYLDNQRILRNGAFGLYDEHFKRIANARDDKLHSYWYKKDISRGITLIDGFFEKEQELKGISGDLIVACIYDDYSFAIVTSMGVDPNTTVVYSCVTLEAL